MQNSFLILLGCTVPLLHDNWLFAVSSVPATHLDNVLKVCRPIKYWGLQKISLSLSLSLHRHLGTVCCSSIVVSRKSLILKITSAARSAPSVAWDAKSWGNEFWPKYSATISKNTRTEKWESDEFRMNSLVQLALLLLPAAHGATISEGLTGNYKLRYDEQGHSPLQRTLSLHRNSHLNYWQYLTITCQCVLYCMSIGASGNICITTTHHFRSSARHLLELSIQNEGCQGPPNAAHLFEFKVIKGHRQPGDFWGGQEQTWSVYCPCLPAWMSSPGALYPDVGVAALGCQYKVQNILKTWFPCQKNICYKDSLLWHSQILLGDHAPVVLQQLATESVVAAVILQLCIVY